MFRKRAVLALCAMCFFALTSCASKPQTGIMAAQWTPPAKSDIPVQTVTIAWESDTSTTGQMTFTLGRGGQRYVGSYLLLENTESHLEAQPLYDIWDTNGFNSITAFGITQMTSLPWYRRAKSALLAHEEHHYASPVLIASCVLHRTCICWCAS